MGIARKSDDGSPNYELCIVKNENSRFLDYNPTGNSDEFLLATDAKGDASLCAARERETAGRNSNFSEG